MKKGSKILVSTVLIAAFLAVTIFSASAAVFVQDGKFKFQLFQDGTASFAGYISDTVDDVTVPRYYDTYTIVGVTNFALENNSKVRSIDFMEAPDLEKIGMYAFHNCSSLESVVVPNSISDVDVGAFRECASLTDVTFFGNNNVVPTECFYNCSSLSNVRLSPRLTSIQGHAFASCTSLEYIELYDSITYIAPNAFDDDDNITLGVFKGTYAHQYAKDKNLRYILIDGPKSGDANGDGMVDILDSTEIQKFAAEKIELTEEQFELADINDDGFVDVIDALLVQKYVVGKYDIPPIIYNS